MSLFSRLKRLIAGQPRPAPEREQPRPEPERERLREELGQRMQRPQRHRLLQGYPMAPLMKQVGEGDSVDYDSYNPERPLIIGVLPHTFCNPKVRGCGFCTFPHERYENGLVRRLVEHVVTEIERTTERWPVLAERKVGGLYFGGGTANLTPPAEFRLLTQSLERSFVLRESEVSLEGVPRYFLRNDGVLLDILAGMQVRHRRISMGVQTFDPAWLARMGRDAFGDEELIHQVVEAAHARGLTASADLLFNLPGRTLEQTLEDVRKAMAIGLDQICVYNLVLTDDLGTEWAKERELVQGMPDSRAACETWLSVRQALLEGGFVQTTLTNFERREVAESPRRFMYELASYDPATWDVLCFGPAAISIFTVPEFTWGNKWSNESTGAGYLSAMAQGRSAVASAFTYGNQDLKLLHLTRNISRLSIDCESYERCFYTTHEADFPIHFGLFEEQGLLHPQAGGSLELTPVGMFYADSIAGLLASKRVSELRANPDAEHLRLRGPMG